MTSAARLDRAGAALEREKQQDQKQRDNASHDIAQRDHRVSHCRKPQLAEINEH